MRQSRRGISVTKRNLGTSLAVASVLGAILPRAFGASASYTGGGTDALWSDAANWSTSPVPGTGDTATFNVAAGTGGAVISLGTGVTIGSIVFDTSGAAAYTIGSGAVGSQTLSLNDLGTITMNSGVVNNELFNSAITLGTATGSNYTFTNNSTTNTLTFAGTIQGGTGGTAAAKTLMVGGTGNMILGTVTKGGSSGISISKSGTGTLTLGDGGAVADNNATSFVLNGGTLILAKSSAPTIHAIGSNSTITSGTLQLAGTGGDQIYDGITLTVNGGFFDLNSRSETIAGLAAAAAGGTVLNNGTGTSTITVGNGTTSSTFAGTLQDNNNSGTGKLALAKVGTGTFTLTGANSYTGATTVSAGTLTVSGAGSLSASTALSVASGAAFRYLPTTATTTQTVGSLTLAGGATLGLDWGTAAIPTSGLVSAGAASFTGTGPAVALSLNGSFNSGTAYTVLQAASGLGTAANFTVLNSTNFTYTLADSGTAVTITPTTAPALTTAYWVGNLAQAPGVWAASGGTTSNWSTTADGTGTSGVTPSAVTGLIFSATGATNQSTMTLGANMSVRNIIVNGTAGSPNETSALTLAATGGYTLTLGTGIIINPGAGAVTLNSNLTLSSTQTWTNNSSNTFTFGGAVTNGGFALTVGGSGNSSLGGIISGTGGLEKTGTGQVVLNAVNTYTGTTVVSAGTLTAAKQMTGGTYSITSNATLEVSNGGGGAAFSQGAATTFNGMGTLKLDSNVTFGSAQNITTLLGAGGLIWVTGGATVTASSNNKGIWNNNLGSLQVDSGSAINFVEAGAGTTGVAQLGAVNGGGNIGFGYNTNTETLIIGANGGSGSYSGVLSYTGTPGGAGAAGSFLYKTGAGTETFTGANTYTFATQIRQGTLAVNTLANAASNSSLGAPAAAQATIVIGNAATTGNLTYVGTGSNTNRPIQIGNNSATPAATDTGGSIIEADGGGALTFTAPAFNTPQTGVIASTARSLTLQGSSMAANTIQGIIADNSVGASGTGSVSLTKAGAGTWVLNGANTYTGVTNVNAGTLTVSGAGSLSPSTALSVASGATFNYLPTTATTVQTIASLSLAGGATLGLEWSTAGSVTGLNSMAAASLNGTNPLVVLNLNGSFTSGTGYTVLQSTNGGLGTAANFTVGNATNFTYTLADNGTSVVITPTSASAPTAEWWQGGFSGALGTNVWADSDGNANSNWATTATGGATPLVPGASTNITFSASGSTGEGSMTLGNNVSVNSITVSETATPLVLAGTGGYTLTIGSTTNPGITVASGASATFNAPITLGTAQTWTSNSTTGAALTVGGNVNNAGLLLTVAGSGNTTIGGIVSGAGGITTSGTGTLTLNGANTYSGTTAINNGTVIVGASGTLGASTAAVTMGSGTSGTTGTVGNLTLGGNTTIGSLTVQSNTSNVTTASNIGKLLIPSGATLTVNGNVNFGVPASTAATNTALSTGTAGTGGTLTVNGSLSLGNGLTTTGNLSTIVADFTGLSQFNETATGGSLQVGFGEDTSGTLILPANSFINVGTLTVANAPNNYNLVTNALATTLKLGGGSTTIQASTLTIGQGKGAGILQFAGSSGSVTITGTGGTGTSAITLANSNSGATYSGNYPSQLLLAGHNATVNAGTVIIANLTNQTASSTGAIAATLTFDTGTFNASAINMAIISGGTLATAVGQATFTVGGSVPNSAATGIVNISGNLVLAGDTDTNITTGNASGTLTLNGGTVNVNTSAVATNGIFDISTKPSSTLLTLAGGTLNLNGGVLGSATTGVGKKTISLQLESGTLQNVKEINDGAALTKISDGTAGGGTLALTGVNAYTGGTNVNAGTVLANSTDTAHGSTGSGLVKVNAGGALAGSGQIRGPITVSTGGTISAGNASGDVTTGAPATLTANAAGATTTFDGGAYAVKINNATGTPGAASGWDLLSLTQLAATANNGTVVLYGLNPTAATPNTAGAVSNFNNTNSYNWVIATVSGASTANLANLAASLQLNTSNFTNNNPLAPGYAFSLGAQDDAVSGSDLIISYSPAPEPTSLVMLGLGAGGLMLRRRRAVRG